MFSLHDVIFIFVKILQMKNSIQSIQEKIIKLVYNYCKKHLDEEYKNLCTILIEDLIEQDKGVFKRGKKEIWAASIVWTIGSVNFLGDKSFEPYATLADVCNYFNVNTSTVGQKAGKIRELFDIENFNNRYQREDSTIGDILGNLVMTDEGFIVPTDWLENNKDVEEEEYFDEDDDELPGQYTIIMSANRSYKRAEIFQLEYAFKSLLDKDEKFQNTKILPDRKIHFNFYGRPAKIQKFEYHHLPKKFIILDVVDQPRT